MFKSTPFSFFWGKSTISDSAKATTNKQDAASIQSPQAFTIKGNGSGLVKVSMVETDAEFAGDGFVDIQCRKLSYAEVASLNPKKLKPTALPAKGRIEKNEFEILKEEATPASTSTSSKIVPSSDPLSLSMIEDELPEKFKSDVHSRKQGKGKGQKKKLSYKPNKKL
ncbi:hypothetical protein CLIB1423_04S04500 [[Candida] railenensis]|uniref:Uncharacterized protein n=1 Tax=[Candida] railenensis TaxID=45579 RepID=A0A9P0VXA9_9ASCO|nr:hypothetical protein CLIB1423_04S04500 [[Candida] railenensis]